MSLRSLHDNTFDSAPRRFYQTLRMCFVVAGILSAFVAFSSITDFSAGRAVAQTNVNKQSQTTPTPEPSDSSTPGEIQEVPDPTAMLLLGSALVGVLGGLYRRRRLKSKDRAGVTDGLLQRKSNDVALDSNVDWPVPSANPKELEEVLCTVFAPDDVLQGDAFLVQAFAHTAAQAAFLAQIAKRADLAASERGSETLGIIERKEELGFYLEMPGLEIDEPQQSLIWLGEIASLKFGVTVPAGFEPRSINCKLSLSRHNVPIGHIRFRFRISAAPRAQSADNGLKVHQEFVRYQLAFISYASSDRSEVLKRVQMLDLVQIRYFHDLLNLEAGKQWEPSIYRCIDECDIFFLFWSSAAKKSKWVRKEVQRALKRKGDKLERPPEILPVPIEGPPPVDPPRYLSAIYFDSTFLYFINAKDKQP